MKSMEKIVVALDFSPCAPDVVARAGDQAEAFGADVALLHIDELPGGVAANDVVTGLDGVDRPAGEYLAWRAGQRLRGLAAPLRQRGLKVSEHVVAGKTAEGIVAAAERLRADLIVMGTHGRTGIPRMVLGSVAEEVLRRAPCPVLTVRTVHRATCAARSCASCRADITAEDEALRAETTG